MKVLNNKVLFEILSEEHQPVKTIFTPTADMLKLCKVIATGSDVKFVKKDDIITLYELNMNMLNSTEGFCIERDIIFSNDLPQPGKIHIKNQEKDALKKLNKAEVVNSNTSDELSKGTKVHYLKGQSHVLPDNTEIISETQAFYSE